MGIFRFIVEDIKKDIRTFKAICQGKAKFAVSGQDFIDNFKDALKENYILFWIVLFAFVSGFFVASQFYQVECNDHIVETFYPWVVNESLRPPGLQLWENINYSEVFGIQKNLSGIG